LLPDIGLIDRGRLQRLVTGRIRVSNRPDRCLIGAGAGDRPNPCQRSA
jgi:hypothetical protein